ncbi:hypothetical protein GC169_02515 [bacterium]|nr:hypothetical protein [bacterium]
MATVARSIIAFNTATESENRIHDDATASRFGFAGGLVPGVDVFGYMAHGPAKAWGEDWLRSGRMQARFLKPVYDGREAVLDAVETAPGEMRLTLSSGGEVCGVGRAMQGAGDDPVIIPGRGVTLPPERRPKASPDSLLVGQRLGFRPEPYTTALGLQHINDIRDDPALFAHGRIANPAYLLRRANQILVEAVVLGPWIHVESDIRLHALAVDGDTLDVRAEVARNFESKGHLIVVLDVAILVGDRPVMSGAHTAIYEPRQVRG